MLKTTLVSVVLVAACGGSSPKKGGGQKGSAAMGTGQMTGGTAMSMMSQGSSQGDTYEGVTCDGSTEGLAWCDDDFDIAFCDQGQWWILDCSQFGDYCGDDGYTVDCYDD